MSKVKSTKRMKGLPFLGKKGFFGTPRIKVVLCGFLRTNSNKKGFVFLRARGV